MENFSYHNPTKIIFGKNEVDLIGSEAKAIGSRALVLIGKGSAKKSGLYARVISSLNMHGVKSETFEGIKSNPTFEDADEAVQLAKEFKADLIIAIGGGSVIDSAKCRSFCLGFLLAKS